jgi:hypothetical protein
MVKLAAVVGTSSNAVRALLEALRPQVDGGLAAWLREAGAILARQQAAGGNAGGGPSVAPGARAVRTRRASAVRVRDQPAGLSQRAS